LAGLTQGWTKACPPAESSGSGSRVQRQRQR
jgi:hypothetical protein